MSLETGKKIVRVLSAKATRIQVQKTRPLSGVSPINFTRKQLIENVYNSQSSDFRRVVSARQPNNNFISQNLEQNRQIRKASIGKTKQKEEMASQILILKQTINKLVEQLSQQKGKVENMRKKNLKYSKILTMEYQDQKQWDSHALSNHLVAGIKNMYDNLKQKYEEKCRQLQSILKKQSITNILERDELIKSLEQQTKQLKVKIQRMNQRNVFTAYTETQKQASQEINKDLKLKLKTIEERTIQTDKRFKEFTKKIKDLQQKIELDKRLLIEKDNTNHFLEKKIKQLTKQLVKTKQLNIILDKQLQETKSILENERQKYEKLVIESAEKLKLEKQILTRSKDVKIQSLEQDNSYLNKMIQDLRSTNLQLNKTNQQLKELNSKNIGKAFRDTTVETLLNNKLNIDTKSNNHQREEKTLKPLIQKGKRIPQRANQKYHQTAIKTRKIQLKEILQISQLIRYKLIGQQLSIQEVKSLFNFNPQNQLNVQQFQWSKQYIKMQEVKNIFKNSPFQLEQDDATAISRYLIEDVQEQFVFCDDMNENHREVVKSIVKTLIQDYPVYKSGCQQYSEVKQIIQRYKTNLKSAIKGLTKETLIPKSKLLEGMKSIGFEASDNIIELILAKIALKSKKLSLLQYSSVF